MKCYTVRESGEVIEGIGIWTDPFPHLRVGGQGPQSETAMQQFRLAQELISLQEEVVDCPLRNGPVRNPGKNCHLCGTRLAAGGLHPNAGKITTLRPLTEAGAMQMQDGRWVITPASRGLYPNCALVLLSNYAAIHSNVAGPKTLGFGRRMIQRGAIHDVLAIMAPGDVMGLMGRRGYTNGTVTWDGHALNVIIPEQLADPERKPRPTYVREPRPKTPVGLPHLLGLAARAIGLLSEPVADPHEGMLLIRHTGVDGSTWDEWVTPEEDRKRQDELLAANHWREPFYLKVQAQPPSYEHVWTGRHQDATVTVTRSEHDDGPVYKTTMRGKRMKATHQAHCLDDAVQWASAKLGEWYGIR